MASFVKGGKQAENPRDGRIILDEAGILRLRAISMLILSEKGWTLRAIGKVFNASPSMVGHVIKEIPAAAVEHYAPMARNLLGGLPGLEGLGRPVRKKVRLRRPRGKIIPRSAPLTVPMLSPTASGGPEGRRLRAQAGIDACCTEAIERFGSVARAAKALRITPARIKAALAREKSKESEP